MPYAGSSGHMGQLQPPPHQSNPLIGVTSSASPGDSSKLQEAEKLHYMESDPLYKQIEDIFYRKFESDIMSYTNGIQHKIDKWVKERDFVI